MSVATSFRGPSTSGRRFFRRLPAAAALLLLAIALGSQAYAQKGDRLIDQDPYDIVTLNKANENKVLKVYPLVMTERRMPDPKPSKPQRMRLMEDGKEYDVNWLDIDKVDFFEQLVLAETNQLVAAEKLDEAYEYFVFLLDFYPKTPGLAESRQAYLYRSVGAAFKQQEYAEALAISEELLAQNRNYRPTEASPPLMEVVGRIADRILATYFEKQDYRSARKLLSRLAKQYNADNEPFVQTWRQRMAESAAKYRDEARQHSAAGKFVEARDAAATMMEIWPELEGANALFADIAGRYPLVLAAVEHPAVALDPRSLHNPAARRAGRLVERLLVEFAGWDADGGKYASPLATLGHSEDGLSLTFRLAANSSQDAGSYALAQRLLGLAKPDSADYQSAWARTLEAVRVTGPRDVRADLRLGHVLPEALLQVPLALRAAAEPATTGPFTLFSQDADITRFTANASYGFQRPGQPVEVTERYFSDPQRALFALKRGEVDLLDRVFPGDIAALAANSSLTVAPYAAPTTHVLAIRSDHPYLSNRTFRRALLYGLNRELILNQGLLRGRTVPGFRVVSGPFAASAPGLNIPAYGYDEQIQPRPFDPRLALTLRILAQGEVKGLHDKAMKPVPPLTPLVLGHPADETSRVACRAILKQWKLIGVQGKLVEFPPGVFDDQKGECDLIYLQLAAWEPIVDAARLMGSEGVAPAASGFVQLTLRQLEQAQNWESVRTRLQQLHRLMHEDVSLLPLYQTVDHYALRRTLKGVAAGRVSLYQDIETWQVSPQLAEAAP